MDHHRNFVKNLYQEGLEGWKSHRLGRGIWKYSNAEENLIIEPDSYSYLGKAWKIKLAKSTETIAIFPKHTENPKIDIQYATSHAHKTIFAQNVLIGYSLSCNLPPEYKYSWLPLEKKLMSMAPSHKVYCIDPMINAHLIKHTKNAVSWDQDEQFIRPCLYQISYRLPSTAHETIQIMEKYQNLLKHL